MSSTTRQPGAILYTHADGVRDPTERAARLALWSLPGVGPASAAHVLSVTQGQAHRLWREPSLVPLVLASGLRARALEASLPDALLRDLDEVEGDELGALPPGGRIIHLGEPGYPSGLARMRLPPWVLYQWGDASALELGCRVAIVGSRAETGWAERSTAELARGLVERGVVVASGGALGLDAVALAAAVEQGGQTVAVLPSGLARLSPASNRDLFDSIVTSGGVIVTEIPPTVTPRRYMYARRNRILAACSDAVVVARASDSSGTMLTVRAARELGVPLGALPPVFGDAGASGTASILARGEPVVLSVSDAVALCEASVGAEVESPRDRRAVRAERATSRRRLLAPTRTRVASVEKAAPPEWVSEDARVAHASLGVDWAAQDALARALGWGPGRVAAALTELELAGSARKAQGASRWRAA